MEQTNQNQNPQQNAQQQFRCPKDCRQCPQNQRIYCASQHALSNMIVLDRVMETLTGMQSNIEKMQGMVEGLAARIEAIQDSEASVFNPDDGAVEGELFPKVYGEAEENAE